VYVHNVPRLGRSLRATWLLAHAAQRLGNGNMTAEQAEHRPPTSRVAPEDMSRGDPLIRPGDRV
jgi:hypothetical protein